MNDTQNWSILVVEDEPDGQEVVAAMLSYFNIASESVATAEEALEVIKHKDYTGIIIDLALPGMDGWTLLGEIRGSARTAKLPCIAITAYHSSAVRQQSIEAGFDAYFAKPLEDTVFVRELSRVILGQ